VLSEFRGFVIIRLVFGILSFDICLSRHSPHTNGGTATAEALAFEINNPMFPIGSPLLGTNGG